jgi:hypothetical protein
MQRFIRVRQMLAVGGVAALVLAGSVTASASTIAGKHNAMDAALVPASF